MNPRRPDEVLVTNGLRGVTRRNPLLSWIGLEANLAATRPPGYSHRGDVCGVDRTRARCPRKLTTDQMKQMVRQHFEDLVNQRIATVIPQNMTPDLYDHDERGGKLTDVAGDERMMLAMYEKMPDLLLTIEDMIAEDDKLVCRNVWRWTDPGFRKRVTSSSSAINIGMEV
jgi:predicted ester cyclase